MAGPPWAHGSTPGKDNPSARRSPHKLSRSREEDSEVVPAPASRPPGAKTWGAGHLLRRELFRFQLERRTPEKAVSTASPLLTTAGTLWAKEQCQ